jgi:putative alpha-1,2-mannosidase
MARGWNWEKAQSGNTHPGAVAPFGWVSACAYSGAYPTGYGRVGTSWNGPAPVIGSHNCAWGVTHFHHSGTGWINRFYNYFLFTPHSDGADISKASRLDGEKACPGRYEAMMSDYGVSVDLTVDRYAACHRYVFRDGQGRLRVDLRQGGLRPLYVHGAYSAYKVERPTVCEVRKSQAEVWQGRVRFHGVDIFFALRMKGEVKSSSCCDGCIDVLFNGETAEAYIGFSLLGQEEAVSRANAVLGEGFDKVYSKTKARWEDVLGRVEVAFSDAGKKSLFYSTLYHSLLKPVDCGRGFVDFSTFWDVYRTGLPLILSLDSTTGRGVCEHLMSVVERKGFSPICQIMDDVVVHKDMQATALPVYTLADAFFRGMLTKVDYSRLKAVFEREFAHADISGMSPTHALDLSGAYGAAAFVADACGDTVYADELRRKSKVWKRAYNQKTGLMHEDAKYYEGNHLNYSFRPHPGMKERVAISGGREGYLAQLDGFFCRGRDFREWSAENDRIRRLGSFEGLNNESDMDSPFAYYWCGRPDRTAEVVDVVRRCRFANGPGGCPGNNDSGGTSSWYVWNCLGLYPLTGTPYYLLGTPSVDFAMFRFSRGVLKIVVERESAKSIYPVEYVFNGRSSREPWLLVEKVEQGGTLVFRLADRPAAEVYPIPDWL